MIHFSVIIPLYNKANYVEKALQSVQNQTYKDFELIVVDDGSTDNGAEIVKQLRITNYELRILEQQNSGVSHARNNGVKAARYDYIAFLDADDWWAPTFLEEMAQLIADFPEGALYASAYYKVKNGKTILSQIGVTEGFERGYFNYFRAYARSLWMPITSITAVVKKAVFEEMNGFKPQLKLGEDFDLWVRIALKYKTVLLNKPLAYYNQDVDVKNRGVRLHKPENHQLFALPELYEQEKSNLDLKQVMDKLRVYGLFPYFLNRETRLLARQELARVDWTKQPKAEYRKYYQTPIICLKTRQLLFSFLSRIKKIVLK